MDLFVWGSPVNTESSIWSRVWQIAKALFSMAPNAVARVPQANAFNLNAQGLSTLKPLLDSADEVEFDIGGMKIEKTTADGKTKLIIRDAQARPASLPTPQPVPVLPPPDG